MRALKAKMPTPQSHALKLAPRTRQVFLLHWQRGLSYAEIARVLGTTPEHNGNADGSGDPGRRRVPSSFKRSLPR